MSVDELVLSLQLLVALIFEMQEDQQHARKPHHEVHNYDRATEHERVHLIFVSNNHESCLKKGRNSNRVTVNVEQVKWTTEKVLIRNVGVKPAQTFLANALCQHKVQAHDQRHGQEVYVE